MFAVSVDRPETLNLSEKPQPAPGLGEVLVRVRRAGICGSDLHIYHGLNPFATYPRVVGHEFMGVVEAVGADVEALSVGERVVIDPVVNCGQCQACTIGRPNVCRNLQVIGVHRDGGMADYTVLPVRNAHRIPEQVSDRLAAMAEPYSIAANVLGRTEVREAEWALIFGAGTMGLTAVQVARMKGAQVVVVEPGAARRKRAETAGAALVLDPQQDNIQDALGDLTQGDGPSLVVDCAGIPQILPQAIDLVAPAGRIGLLSFSPEPIPIKQQDLIKKELSLFASRLNKGLIPAVLDWFAQGLVDGESLISHEFSAQQAVEAFQMADQSPEETVKVHLLFNPA